MLFSLPYKARNIDENNCENVENTFCLVGSPFSIPMYYTAEREISWVTGGDFLGLEESGIKAYQKSRGKGAKIGSFSQPSAPHLSPPFYFLLPVDKDSGGDLKITH